MQNKISLVAMLVGISFATGASLASEPDGSFGSANYEAFNAAPDLRFVTTTVQLLSVPGIPLLNYGGLQKVPCNTSGIRIRYRYGNGGTAAAGAHKNTGQALGSATYTFAEGPLASGAVRTALISVGAIVAPNVNTEIRIRLDSMNQVAESSEANNLFRAFVRRVCP